MKKDFNGKFKAEGQREYNIMAILNTLDKAKNGDGGKHIVTVQNVPSKWKGGFAFTTPLALCSLAEFQQDRSRVTGLTNGIILKSLVQGVEFLHENYYAHGDIKPANVVFSKPCGLRTLEIRPRKFVAVHLVPADIVTPGRD